MPHPPGARQAAHRSGGSGARCGVKFAGLPLRLVRGRPPFGTPARVHSRGKPPSVGRCQPADRVPPSGFGDPHGGLLRAPVPGVLQPGPNSGFAAFPTLRSRHLPLRPDRLLGSSVPGAGVGHGPCFPLRWCSPLEEPASSALTREGRESNRSAVLRHRSTLPSCRSTASRLCSDRRAGRRAPPFPAAPVCSVLPMGLSSPQLLPLPPPLRGTAAGAACVRS